MIKKSTNVHTSISLAGGEATLTRVSTIDVAT
jgi:hypothetical protein